MSDNYHHESSPPPPPDNIEVTDTFVWKARNTNDKKHHAYFLPQNIRCLIIGKSGFGKSTLLFHLLLEPGILDYNTITVCGNSLHQPEYRVMEIALRKKLSKSQIKVLFEEQDEIEKCGGYEKLLQSYNGECKGSVIQSDFFSDVNNIPDPVEYDANRKNVLVMDDVMLDSQSKAEAFYTRGRHNRVDVFYISQSYFRLPRQTIRENANFFVFFSQDKKNLIHIYNDHCSGDDISFQTFFNFCNNVWNESKHNFVVIDTTRPINCGKYRKNLTLYWCPHYERLTDDNGISSPLSSYRQC